MKTERSEPFKNKNTQLCLVKWRSQRTTLLDTTCTIHDILSTAPQLSISQKALETLSEDGNVMSKHVGATIHN
jgi:hypothetical protein